MSHWNELPSSRNIRSFWWDGNKDVGQVCMMIIPQLGIDKYHLIIEGEDGTLHLHGRFTAEEIKRFYEIDLLSMP
jgi:hypothetical protein